MAREGVYPSAVEVQVMRNAFDVPVATEEVNKQKPRFHPKTGRLIRLHLIEMEWIVSHTLERSAA